MLELCGMWSNLSLPSLPSPLWPGVIASGRVQSIGQIELNYVIKLFEINCFSIFQYVNKKLCTYAKLNCLK